jgi:hypothetical protein
VVNVYRLITRDTLEEKIMGLQRFKLNIANSVVNEDNASLKSMDTAQLLDLFTPVDASAANKVRIHSRLLCMCTLNIQTGTFACVQYMFYRFLCKR